MRVCTKSVTCDGLNQYWFGRGIYIATRVSAENTDRRFYYNNNNNNGFVRSSHTRTVFLYIYLFIYSLDHRRAVFILISVCAIPAKDSVSRTTLSYRLVFSSRSIFIHSHIRLLNGRLYWSRLPYAVYRYCFYYKYHVSTVVITAFHIMEFRYYFYY